ncbi:Anoctamin-7, partial [Eschrichtius robustus]|nr:Anoctamin-7 [Eschrichtius robustus]
MLHPRLSRSPPSRQRDVQDEDSVVRRLLFSAPWAVLRCYAEDLGLKLPLQDGEGQLTIPSRSCPTRPPTGQPACWSGWGVPNILLEDVPDVPPKSYSCQFEVRNLSRFLGSENQATFFPITYRHQILFEILAKTPYGHERKRLFGTDQLLGEGVFSAAFPLHDGPLTTPSEGPRALGLTQRQVRLQPWARWRQWHKYQPLDHVRRYFGEKVAFYFARLRLYTGWLVPVAGAGTLVSLVGCLMVSSDAPRAAAAGLKHLAAPRAAVVVMCLVSIVLHRAIMAVTVSRPDNTPLAAWASCVASLMRSTVNLVFILNLSKVYVALACVLTKWETHRTQTKFEDAFTLKVFIFQFVNFYSSPIYIAFFKG